MKRKLPTNIGTGLLYFYIHFVTEVICFYLLTKYTDDTMHVWIVTLAYDMLAFVPQSVIGSLSDKYRKIPFGIIGLFLLGAALILFDFSTSPYMWLVILCLGNACTHISGAEVTLRSSGGKLSHSAIFVSGGSFGVITGKLLANTFVTNYMLVFLAATAVPFVLLAKSYLKESDSCLPFNKYHNGKMKKPVVILLVVFVVAVRGYMGYGIPTSWNKTTFQTVMLFVSMGAGKALGGILADIFGVRKVAVFSTVAALPFLLFGDNYMMISLVGVMLFSMTMSITLALLVSVLPDNPGLAFGLTTIGLFIGTAPVFFFKFTTVLSNCIIITILTVLCLICIMAVTGKDDRKCKV